MLVHGWTSSSDLNWFTAYAQLAEHFRVIGFDLRGHGHTGLRTRGRFRLTDCADDAAALADALGIERFIAVGYSMGGAIASLVWQRHRRRVDGLVLCATAPVFAHNRSFRLQMGLLGPIAASTRAMPRPAAQRVYEEIVWRRTKDRDYHPWMVDEIRAADPRMMLEAGYDLGRFDSRGWLGQIDTPASVVVMTRDSLVPTARQFELAHALPRARTYEVEGDHVVCVGNPRAFVPVFVEACLDVAARVAVADRVR